MSTSRPQVVIVRKHKRLGPGHWVAAALTGGASIPFSVAKAGTNALYNERTRQMQAPPPPPARRGRRTR